MYQLSKYIYLLIFIKGRLYRVLVTIKEIADKCGVSIATVSRAFTPNSVINPQTKDKILKVAKELDYRPNIMARGLKNSNTQTVGIIVPSIDNYFYLDVLKHIEYCLHKYGYRLIVSFIQRGGYGEKEALNTIEDSRADALIFSPRNTENSDIVNRLKNKIHMLQLFTAPYNDISSIIMDDVYGTKIATEHLISNGYKRILYIGGDERVQGYYEALENAGIEIDENLVSLNWGISEEDVKQKILSLNPSAIIGVARQAETAWCAITSLNIHIPFIAYDDVNWVKMFDITAVAHPLDEIAENIVEYIISCIEQKSNQSINKIIKPFLIERSSSK